MQSQAMPAPRETGFHSPNFSSRKATGFSVARAIREGKSQRASLAREPAIDYWGARFWACGLRSALGKNANRDAGASKRRDRYEAQRRGGRYLSTTAKAS